MAQLRHVPGLGRVDGRWSMVAIGVWLRLLDHGGTGRDGSSGSRVVVDQGFIQPLL